MNTIKNSTTAIDHRNLIDRHVKVSNFRFKNKDVKNDHKYHLDLDKANKKTINKKVVNSDALNVNQSQKNTPALDQENKKEIGWFSVLDGQGYEGFVKTGHIEVNKNREISIDNYTLLDIHNKPIIVPENKTILIKSEGIVVAQDAADLENNKVEFLGQLKNLALNNDDVIMRDDGAMYDLSDSGIEKYKQNELDIQNKLVSKKTSMKKDQAKAINLINILNEVRAQESRMKFNLDNNDEKTK
ncbi:hypothetical protein [Buchnera aphidicola]|uniref:hypothetical protein n=1 Tax=Buchnera aphidicola TaxID=9 RepID=UPI00094C9315|nr:hypothetical protein [Buchnera aphidicola]